MSTGSIRRAGDVIVCTGPDVCENLLAYDLLGMEEVGTKVLTPKSTIIHYCRTLQRKRASSLEIRTGNFSKSVTLRTPLQTRTLCGSRRSRTAPHKIQTQKGSNERLFIFTRRHSMHFFFFFFFFSSFFFFLLFFFFFFFFGGGGGIPLVKPQNDT